ncbi:translation elongation factor Ts [Buchnera aphidicola]|uniref:translation elongation factor Ts n=1 Tax=Buchnera aphidicola TaxID=9 RepID=UPI0034648E4A
MHINKELIKKLRLKSGIGILDCKKALIDSDGNFDKAIVILKKRGYVKAENKIKNSTLRGIIATHVLEQYSCILELNCETDFVEQHANFVQFAQKILYTIHKEKIYHLNLLNDFFKKERLSLIAQFGENIVIRRFSILNGEFLFSYIHRNKIGVLLSSESYNTLVMKKISMHIIANNPDYLKRESIPNAILEREKEIQVDIAMKSGKPEFIAQKIVSGRIEKFIQNICLLEQSCVFDTDIVMKDFLLQNNFKIVQFIRFELGEEI